MNKLLVALVLTGATLVPAEMELRSVPTTTELKLPKPLSDATASVGQDGLIYIAGGCDSAFGNQYIASTDTFRCTHVSRSFYAFDPLTDQFETLPDMPDPRHRHTAVAINNQIWLVGGRDGNDAVVGRVHVSALLFNFCESIFLTNLVILHSSIIFCNIRRSTISTMVAGGPFVICTKPTGYPTLPDLAPMVALISSEDLQRVIVPSAECLVLIPPLRGKVEDSKFCGTPI